MNVWIADTSKLLMDHAQNTSLWKRYIVSFKKACVIWKVEYPAASRKRNIRPACYSDPISFEISEGTSMKKIIFLKIEKNDVKGNAFWIDF